MSDAFWTWLLQQRSSVLKSLFATFPHHPGQTAIFYGIWNAIGRGTFEAKEMHPFATSLSWMNRHNKIDGPMAFPHGRFEINDNRFVASETDRIREEMSNGQHCGIQSNECRDLNECCGPPASWQFKWPRDPTPSVEEWARYWVQKVDEHGDNLWNNPLSTPWIWGVYMWPSPTAECDWVHSKLIHEEPLEEGAAWYKYDAHFHNNLCNSGNPNFHPDAIPGIANYGGVCGRMAQLEWRKTGCMGVPATQKGEPGHCAGMKIVPAMVAKTPLSSDGGQTCLICTGQRNCHTGSPGSSTCTTFLVDGDNSQIVIDDGPKKGKCIDIARGGILAHWVCNGGGNQRTVVLPGRMSAFLDASRGTFTFTVPTGGQIPAPRREWTFEGIHEISCTRENCNYPTVLGLDSNANAIPAHHKEGFLALMEAYNTAEDNDGVYPVAFDEARLAASFAFHLTEVGGADADIDAALEWAMDRNPAQYEPWVLAAERPGLQAARTQARGNMPSRQFFNSLSLLQKADSVSQKQQAMAERFARKKLLDPKMTAHWERYPNLLHTLTAKLCSSLKDDTLSLLGEAGETCLRSRRLVAEDVDEWDVLWHDMLAADNHDEPNTPNRGTIDFYDAYAILSQLMLSDESANVAPLLTEMLSNLAVCYISPASESFFARHDRCILRGPYAMVLQLASVAFNREERQTLARQTAEILRHPENFPERVWGEEEMVNRFMQWLGRHRGRIHAGTNEEEHQSLQDSVDGWAVTDHADEEILSRFMSDAAVEAELGMKTWDESWTEEHGAERYDIDVVLRSLLDLPGAFAGEETAGNAGLEEDETDEIVPAHLEASFIETEAAANKKKRTDEVFMMCLSEVTNLLPAFT
jgi:hypothetical protein